MIAGGGIGGLAAGLALRRAGMRVRVLEQAPELTVVGAGLSLQANALRALGVLGLDTAAVARGARFERIRFRRPDGRLLADVDLTPISARLDAPFVGIHRAALQEILLSAFGREGLDLGCRARSFETTPDGVSVLLADGRRVSGRALVGADGIASEIRSALLGPREPRPVGFVAWRGTARVPTELAEPILEESLGRGLRFGRLLVGADRVYWYAVTPSSVDGGKARLLELFAGWHPPVVPLLERTGAGEILRTEILHLPTPGRWGRGAVTLLGDAAHAMTPDLGQGACQALEDAVALGLSVAEAGGLEQGFRRYEERRLARARRFARQSRLLGRVLNCSSRVGSAVRDAAIRATPARLVQRRLASALETGW